jgi:hypothetical protein
MSPDIPPEAEVIRLAREAMDMTAQDAAEASRARDGKGVSAAYWRDVERGHGGRRGKQVPTRASARALAAMARVVGVLPAQLAGAGREDAARVLTEILRREGRPASALTVVPSSPVTAEEIVREAESQTTFEADPDMAARSRAKYLAIAGLVSAAIARNPASAPLPAGGEIFGEGTFEAVRWDQLIEMGRESPLTPGGFSRGELIAAMATTRVWDDDAREAGHGGAAARLMPVRA